MQNGCTGKCSRFDPSECQCLGEDSVTAAVSTAAVATTTRATAAATTVATATGTTATTTAAVATAAGTTAATTATVSAATAATATAAITAAAGATTAEAAWTLFTRTGLIDDQGAAFHLLAIHAVDGRLRLSVRAHLDKTKTLGATGFTVHHDFRRRHRAELSECLLEIVVSYAVRQVTDVEFVAH